MAGNGEGRGRRSTQPVREDAYTRVALRLREVASADREWLLSRLDADDCQRVSVALQEYRAKNAATAPVSRKTPKPRTDSAAQPAARLAAASAADVKRLFAGQPDWAIALVLSAGPWPWAPELLGQWVPERIRALRALAGELSERVKPQLRDEVVRLLALKLVPVELQTPVTQAFDAALQRAVDELPLAERWKLDLS
jgi:hypothetical protein